MSVPATFPLQVWENRNGPGRATNADRSLTHSSDLDREGLGMKPTHTHGAFDDALMRRFWSKAELVESGCLVWTAGLTAGKYPAIRVGRATINADRVAFYHATNTMPPRGIRLVHTCDNTKCVNPSHVSLPPRPEDFTEKACFTCKRVLSIENFRRAPRMRSQRSSYCNECEARRRREAYAADPETFRARSRERAKRVRTPERSRERHIKAKYGLSRDDYNALLAEQGNRCAICRAEAPGGKGDWHVDHCHGSSRVRGLLCAGCNVGLGHMRDDPARLRAAADYIERQEVLR